MKKILVPVDGSDNSQRAARLAAEMAGVSGGTFTLLHVFDAPTVAAMGMVALGHLDIAAMQQAAGEECLAKVRESLTDAQPTDCRSELGSPFSKITTIAKEEGFDHIVMGCRGMSAVKEILLGSVSHSVMQHAPCPVTIVR